MNLQPATLNPPTSDSIFAFSYGRVSSRASGGVSRQDQSIEVQEKIFTDFAGCNVSVR